MPDSGWTQPERVEVDVRKFHEYVLDPAKANGKDGVFLGVLGFRTLHFGDAVDLASIYVKQAEQAIEQNAVEVGSPTRYGMRCTIAVEVRGVSLRSGWLREPDGVLRLVTPFSGFARVRKGS